MVGKISTGPSDSFIATNKIRVKSKRTSNTPWFMCLELQSGATHMPQQIDVRDHRKCNDHDSLSISQRGSRRIVTMIVCRHSAQYVGISTWPVERSHFLNP